MKGWKKMVLMVIGGLFGLGYCADKYKLKDRRLQTESGGPLETQTTIKLQNEIETLMEEMPEPETTAIYGRLEDVLVRFFDECMRCKNIVEKAVCEKERAKVREEIAGKLVEFTGEIDIKGWDWREGKGLDVRGYCGEGWAVQIYPVLKIENYNPENHIMRFGIYDLVAIRSQTWGKFREEMCPNGDPMGPYFIAVSPPHLRTQIVKEEKKCEEKLVAGYGRCIPFEEVLFKEFLKEFSSDEEAIEWQKDRKFGIRYVIRIERPFAVYEPEADKCVYGLMGDIVGYKVTTWKSRIDKIEY
jgi:hypothetical protein